MPLGLFADTMLEMFEEGKKENVLWFTSEMSSSIFLTFLFFPLAIEEFLIISQNCIISHSTNSISAINDISCELPTFVAYKKVQN